jgi:oligopeptide transport system substrate-binding protein
MAELGIPQSVQVAIETRIRALPAETQDLLQFAAMMGREFRCDVLLTATEVEEEALFELLEQAERAQLIEEVQNEEDIFSFTHALIPTTLVDGLRTRQKKRLHYKVANAMEAVNPEDWEALAYHFDNAGEDEKAIDYLLKAGDRTRLIYAYQEAINLYEKALDLLQDLGQDQEAGRLLMRLGLLYHSTFDFERSSTAYHEGFTLWQKPSGFREKELLQPAPHPYRTIELVPTTLNPTMCADTVSMFFIRQLFSGLVEETEAMDLVPHIARSWEVLEHGRKYVFHLRDDFYWTDGEPVTARDFEFAWKKVLDPQTGSLVASRLFDIRNAKSFNQGDVSEEEIGVKAIDNITLSVELESPTSYFLHLVSRSVTKPIPMHSVEKYGEAWAEPRNLVTNGSFNLDLWEPEEKIVLVRNPKYPGRFEGNLDEVELHVLPDWQDQLERYEHNELDVLGLGLVPTSEFNNLRQRFSHDYITGPEASTTYLGINFTLEPFTDKRVRQAFAHAIDKKKIANVILQGISDPATGGFVPHEMPGHSPNIGLSFNPQLARKLLLEAGYSHVHDFSNINIFVHGDPWQRERFKAVEDELRKNTELPIEFTYLAFDVLRERILEEKPHIFGVGWTAGFPDPDLFLGTAARTFIPPNWNEQYDKLVENARQVLDLDERLRLYTEADKILMEEAVVIPISYARIHLFVKPWVKRFPIPPINTFSYKDVVIEPH